MSLVNSTVIAIAERVSETETSVSLLSIFDKSEVANISDKELKDLIKAFHENEI